MKLYLVLSSLMLVLLVSLSGCYTDVPHNFNDFLDLSDDYDGVVSDDPDYEPPQYPLAEIEHVGGIYITPEIVNLGEEFEIVLTRNLLLLYEWNSVYIILHDPVSNVGHKVSLKEDDNGEFRASLKSPFADTDKTFVIKEIQIYVRGYGGLRYFLSNESDRHYLVNDRGRIYATNLVRCELKTGQKGSGKSAMLLKDVTLSPDSLFDGGDLKVALDFVSSIPHGSVNLTFASDSAMNEKPGAILNGWAYINDVDRVKYSKSFNKFQESGNWFVRSIEITDETEFVCNYSIDPALSNSFYVLQNAYDSNYAYISSSKVISDIPIMGFRMSNSEEDTTFPELQNVSLSIINISDTVTGRASLMIDEVDSGMADVVCSVQVYAKDNRFMFSRHVTCAYNEESIRYEGDFEFDYDGNIGFYRIQNMRLTDNAGNETQYLFHSHVDSEYYAKYYSGSSTVQKPLTIKIAKEYF